MLKIISHAFYLSFTSISSRDSSLIVFWSSIFILFSVSDPNLGGENVRHLFEVACSWRLSSVATAQLLKSFDFTSFPSQDRQIFRECALLSDYCNLIFVSEYICSDNFFSLPTVLKILVYLLLDLSFPQTEQKLTFFHLQ